MCLEPWLRLHVQVCVSVSRLLRQHRCVGCFSVLIFCLDMPKTPKASHRKELNYSNLGPTADFTPIKLGSDYKNSALSPCRSYDSALNDIKALEKQSTPVHEK